MKRMRQLLKEWESASLENPRVTDVMIKLTTHDYARIRALVEIFPGRSEAQLVSELLTVALDEVEEAMPYIPGNTVIAEDEFGDPIYQDVGLTHRFEELVKKYQAALK